MRPRYARILVIGAITLIAFSDLAFSQVELYFDDTEWQEAVGEFTTIDFTQFPSQTIITDQYAHLGVVFEGNNRIFETPSFVNDGHGLAGFGGTWLNFSEPMNWLALDFPGIVQLRLFDGEEMFYESGGWGNDPTGNFGGLISDQAFDRVYLFLPWPLNNNVFIDDLHFGPAIPAPGALGLLAIGALIGPRRRRRRRRA